MSRYARPGGVVQRRWQTQANWRSLFTCGQESGHAQPRDRSTAFAGTEQERHAAAKHRVDDNQVRWEGLEQGVESGKLRRDGIDKKF
jgi:hypothetical protein